MINKNRKIARVGLIAALYAVVTLALGSLAYSIQNFRNTNVFTSIW